MENPNNAKPVRTPLREQISHHRRSIMRRIEYQRLKRIRKRSVPAYVHCKNCGEKLQGMYCHRCGQYALDIRQPFWKYLRQYFENVYQFDSKVWQTLYLLFRRPGLLTQEFNAGKINSYVHPLRLFMFLSALFFLFTFFILPDNAEDALGLQKIPKELQELRSPDVLAKLEAGMEETEYTEVWVASPHETLRGLESIVRIGEIPGRDTLRIGVPEFFVEKGYLLPVPGDTVYRSSTDPLLPVEARTLFGNTDEVKKIKREMMYERIVGWFAKWLPVILLLLIPVFALMLKAFFRKRHMRYMTHFVLALHLHAGLLILLSLLIAWALLFGLTAAAGWTTLGAFLLYMTLALHRVYGNGWIKSAVKTLLLYGIYLIFTIIILVTALVIVVLPIVQENGWW